MKSILFVFALLFATGVAAQNPYIAIQGATQGEDGVVVSQPRTILAVDVTAECDMTLCGVYARYAQKFLGVRAPLTDKTVWSVKRASVGLICDKEAFGIGERPSAKSEVMQYAVAEGEFARLQADKNDMTVLALEDAARQAATTIFSLRKHRQDLITGEAGENVFGGGLKAALDEIARLEQSYLELFLGKRVVSTASRRYVVNPQTEKKQYIVCRFSPADGLLPDSDLSGDMVVLQIDPSTASGSDIEAGFKVTNVVPCRVAAPSVCTVIAAGKEFARETLPIFEFGRTINVALPRSK